MKPAGRSVWKARGGGAASFGRVATPSRLKQRNSAEREMSARTQRRITSRQSSSDSPTVVRSSAAIASSAGSKRVVERRGREGRSAVSARARQRRTVVSLTPSSAAKDRTEARLAWI